MAPGLTWEPDVKFGGSFVLWSCGGHGGEARKCQEWAGPGAGLERWNGALGVLESSNIPREISDIVGESAEGNTESLQVRELR